MLLPFTRKWILTERRAGGGGGSSGSSGGGGGGRGGGSGGGSSGGSSGGSKGGSSGGSSGGGSAPKSPSSGGGSGGGASSGLRGGSTLRGGGGSSTNGRPLTSSGQSSTARGGGILGRPSTTYYRSGTNRPIIPTYFLLFGFWPIIWIYDYPDGSLPTNNTRPGGDLITAAVQSPDKAANVTYIVYGDTQSVQEIIPAIIEGCSAANTTSSAYNSTANDTMQYYREDSFALLGVGLNAKGRNTTFESCLNDTISNSLPVLEPATSSARPSSTPYMYSAGQQAVGPIGAGWGLVVLLSMLIMGI